MTIPTLQDFLQQPKENIRQLAPKTVILCIGGTRRSAALEGIEPHSTEFVHWSQPQLINLMNLLFEYGVENIISIAVISTNMSEFSAYKKRFLAMVDYGLANEQMLKYYNEHQWRVRLVGTDDFPELHQTSELLKQQTNPSSKQTLWWITSPFNKTPWEAVFETARKYQCSTRQEAIRAIYGEDIPLATMMIATGKPILMYDLVPPLLVGKLQCYWSQRPGYRMNETMLRTILYDYAFIRDTGAASLEDKYTEIEKYSHYWNNDYIIGEGEKLGSFWYPKPFNHPE